MTTKKQINIEGEGSLKDFKLKLKVNPDKTIGQLLIIVKKKLKLNEKEAIFMFINNEIPKNSSLICEYFNKYSKEEILIIKIAKEETFG